MHTAPNDTRKGHPTRRLFTGTILAASAAARSAGSQDPRVSTEEPVYEFTPAGNGAGPLWDYGAPGIVRFRETVFVPGLETIAGEKPLHNCRWALHRRSGGQWRRVAADEKGRQREPCPIGIFEDGRLVLSVNPTLTAPGAYNGPADPQLLFFARKDPGKPPVSLRPVWKGRPRLTEHTYRGMGIDGRKRELLLLHNDGSGAPKAFWAHLDRRGYWSNGGVIEYPIRGCYPQVALRDGTAHVLAVGDVVEPVAEWKRWKFESSGGRQWDYVFRRLYYVSNPGVSRGQFGDILEVANVDPTAGHITNLDLWLAPDGTAHLLYLVRKVTSRAMRDRFFPGVPLTISLEHATVRNNRVTSRQTILAGKDEEGGEVPAWARLHATVDGRLLVLASTRTAGEGSPKFAMRLFAVDESGDAAGRRLELQHPFSMFMTATERGGSRPSNWLDIVGIPAGAPQAIRYACVEL